LVQDSDFCSSVVFRIYDDDGAGENVAVFLAEDAGLAALDSGFWVRDGNCGVNSQGEGE
jgi:hypothetical protein